MTTQWDAERLRAKVESWTPRAGQQIGLGQSTGLVVRVYDHGPADGRQTPGALVFDSEVAHGSAGIFGGSDEARDFADRIEEAILMREQWREDIQHERREGLDAAQGSRFREYDRAKAEAAEATARAKVQQKEIRTLRDEAAAPDVVLDCPLRGEGYRVILSPSLTDGTIEEAEGRTLVNTIPDPKPKTASRRRSGTVIVPAATAIDEAIAATEAAKPKGRRKKKKTPEPEEAAPKLPKHVPDAGGLPLRIGSRVDCPGHPHIREAEVTKILRQDQDGSFIVEVEDQDGIPTVAASTELVKIEGRDEPDDQDWPD